LLKLTSTRKAVSQKVELLRRRLMQALIFIIGGAGGHPFSKWGSEVKWEQSRAQHYDFNFEFHSRALGLAGWNESRDSLTNHHSSFFTFWPGSTAPA
jgi:hypothetical protein